MSATNPVSNFVLSPRERPRAGKIVLASHTLGAQDGWPAVFIHCFLGHSGAWKGLLAALEPKPAALAFDLPGHGQSPMPDHPGDLHAAVVEALAEALPRNGRKPIGVGHSFGGAVLLRHALAEPQYYRGLVLIEPVFFAAVRGQPAFALWEEAEGPVYRALQAGQAEKALRHFLAVNGDGTPWEALPMEERERLLRLIPLLSFMAEGVLDDSGDLLRPGRMEAFAVPVLLLAGERSPPIFGAVCAALAERLGCAKRVVVPEAGHMLPITHPREVAAVISAWRTGLEISP